MNEPTLEQAIIQRDEATASCKAISKNLKRAEKILKSLKSWEYRWPDAGILQSRYESEEELTEIIHTATAYFKEKE